MKKKTLLVYNGTLVTMDPENPQAEAVFIQGDRIEYAGSGQEAFSKAGGDSNPAVRYIDLEGRTVVPGFNDNHVHALILGDHRSVPSLAGLDADEIVDAVTKHYPAPDREELILAYEWDYPACPNPHRKILDAAFPDNPVVLVQFSGHGVWVNTKTLEAMGIDQSAPADSASSAGNHTAPEDPLVRDEEGNATGIIRDSSSNSLLMEHFKKVHRNPALARERLETALREFRERGITSFQDNTWFFPAILGYRRLKRHGRLTARVSCWLFGNDPKRSALMNLPLYGGNLLTRGPWKFILDGSFSAHTGWLCEPYANDPGNYGRGVSASHIEGYLEFLLKKNRQGAFHAIGDRAVKEFLDAAEKVAGKNPRLKDFRLRIEHAQLIRKEDIKRIRDLNILVAAQPSALATPDKDRELLGEERVRKAYPYRSLLDAGVRLSFGSDVPGERFLDPLFLMHLAVNREGEEAITAEDALRCYTVGSAYAEFEEDRKGRIKKGMFADLTVLSNNPLEVPKEKIKDIEADMTIVGGKVMYERPRKGKTDFF
jgi:hypothetical protein